MNKILIILSFLYLGCSSTPSVKKKVALEDVSKEDFIKPEEVSYSNRKDQFSKIEAKDSAALNAESLQRLEDPDDIDVTSVLDDIIVKCYDKEFQDAFTLIQANYDKYKQHPIFWNQVGTCYMLKGNRRKALLFYNKALEHKSSYAPAYNNLGVMYRAEKEDPKALVAYTRARKSHQFARTPKFNLGQLYLEYGLYNQALSCFKSLYNISKSDVEVLAGLATAHLMQGDLKEALKYFGKIDEDYWRKPHIGVNYALARFYNGDKEDAKDIFEDIEPKKLGAWRDYYKKVRSQIGVK